MLINSSEKRTNEKIARTPPSRDENHRILRRPTFRTPPSHNNLHKEDNPNEDDFGTPRQIQFENDVIHQSVYAQNTTSTGPQKLYSPHESDSANDKKGNE
jgi:hypothetical protein